MSQTCRVRTGHRRRQPTERAAARTPVALAVPVNARRRAITEPGLAYTGRRLASIMRPGGSRRIRWPWAGFAYRETLG